MTGSSKKIEQLGSSFISGMPSIVEYTETLVANYQEAVLKAVQEIKQEEEISLINSAKTEGSGWEGISSSLSIKVNSDLSSLKYEVVGSEKDMYTSMVLEFGDETNSPIPLLRTSSLNANKSFVKKASDRAYDLLRFKK